MGDNLLGLAEQGPSMVRYIWLTHAETTNLQICKYLLRDSIQRTILIVCVTLTGLIYSFNESSVIE